MSELTKEQPTEKNWVERHPRWTLLIVNVTLLLLAEGSLRALAYYGLVPIKQFVGSDLVTRYLGDINPHFGVWHFPNRQVRHSAPCFDVQYTSNSYGARDSERSLETAADRRAVVLGDSFVEGLGVTTSERVTDIAERITGIELLNFGVSGNFSSTQQWLLYRELASKFEHSEVFVYLLPANDFEDNDPAVFSKKRYRPYLRELAADATGGGGRTATTPDEIPEFEVYYTVPFEQRESPKPISDKRRMRYAVYNSVYLLNVIRQLGEHIEDSDWKDAVDDQAMRAVTADYDNFNTLDLQRLLWGYEQLLELAGDRPVTFMIIPRDVEFIQYRDQGYNFRIVQEMQKFAERFPNVRVVDLLPSFIDYAAKHKLNYEDFFIPCDGHWSALGHRVAAQVLAESVKTNHQRPRLVTSSTPQRQRAY